MQRTLTKSGGVRYLIVLASRKTPAGGKVGAVRDREGAGRFILPVIAGEGALLQDGAESGGDRRLP